MRERLVVVAVVLIATLPFVGKAFHIDDAYFLSLAQEIPRHPLDPYAGAAGLDRGDYAIFAGEGRPPSTFDAMSHPPLVPYVLAAAGALFGYREAPLHLTFLAFALSAALAFHDLARRHTTAPLAATLLLVTSPIFVLASHSLMTDIPVLALTLTAIACFARGLDRGRRGLFLLAGVLAGLAVVARYTGVVAFLLLPLYAWARGRPVRDSYLALAAGLLTASIWVGQNLAVHGTAHILVGLTHYGRSFGAMLLGPTDIADRLVSSVAGLGGTMIALAAAVLVTAPPRRLPLLLLSLATAFALCLAWAPGTIGTHTMGSRVVLAAFVGAGLLLVVEAVRAGLSAGREGRLLAVWCVGLLTASGLLLPSGTARYLLPALPPLILILVDRAQGLGRRVALCAAVLSLGQALLLATADAEYAASYRQVAAQMRATEGRIFFTGDWGFRFYMERAGHRYLWAGGDVPADGDLVVNPRIAGLPELPPGVAARATLLRTLEVPGRLPIRLMSPEAGAGYYSYAWGLLPFWFARAPLERFDIYRVGPSPSG